MIHSDPTVPRNEMAKDAKRYRSAFWLSIFITGKPLGCWFGTEPPDEKGAPVPMGDGLDVDAVETAALIL